MDLPPFCMYVWELGCAFRALALYRSACLHHHRWEIRGTSQTFPVNIYSLAHAHGFFESQECGMCQSFPKPSMDNSFHRILGFWSAFYFPQLVSPLQLVVMLNSSWFLWENTPEIGISSLNDICIKSDKDISKFCEWAFPRELPDSSGCSLKMWHFGHLQTHSAVSKSW